MEEYVKIINDTYNLVKEAEQIKDVKKLNEFIGKEGDKKFKIIMDFYDDIHRILLLLYSNTEDKEKSEIYWKVKHVCKWIISNSAVFQNSEYHSFIPDTVLQLISNKEEYHVFSLINKGNLNDFDAELEHTAFREELEGIIKEKEENNRSFIEKSYLNRHDYYYKILFSHSINLVEKYLFEIPKVKLEFFLSALDNSGYLEDITSKEDDELKSEDNKFIYQYVRFILKYKSIFKEEELVDDPLIKGLFHGKIKSRTIIEKVFSSKETKSIESREQKKIGTPFNYKSVFSELLEGEGYDIEHFYKNLVNHFKQVGMDGNTINLIIREIIDIDDRYDDILQYIADEGLDRINEFRELMNNSDVEDSSYLITNSLLFEMLKKKENEVFLNRIIDIPFDYAIRNLKEFPTGVLETIQTHVDSGYYDQEQCDILKEKMIENGLYKERKELLYEETTSLLKRNFDEGIELDEETFKACLISISKRELEKYNLDSDVKLYFGDSSSKNGFVRAKGNIIWINNDLIDSFIHSNENDYEKVKVFCKLFHEIKHLKQMNDMENGKIDYLAYNFIKEEIIRKYDPDFYDSNYFKMFIEEDAREFGIIDAMIFLKSLGIKDFEKIFEEYRQELTAEIQDSNLVDDSIKKVPFRKADDIDISDYISSLIYSNPEIIDEYDGILKIEYEEDGTRKSLEKVLEEFYQIKTREEQDQKFSIYCGIVNKLYDNTNKDNISDELKEKIDRFNERRNSLISVKDMRQYFNKEDLTPIYGAYLMELIEKDIKGKRPNKYNSSNKKDGEEYDGRS